MFVSKILPLATVAVVAVVALGGVAGIHAGGFEAIHDGEVVEQLMDHIGVSGAVRDDLLEVHREFVAGQDRFSAKKALSHETLSAALFDEVFDEQAIRDAAAEFAAVQADEFVAQARMMQRVRELLTPEQYEKLAEAHGAIEGHGPGHGHGHGDMHPKH